MRVKVKLNSKQSLLHRKRLKAKRVNTNKVILGDDEQH